MSKALAKIKKLRGRGLDEFGERGRQACAAFAERHGWPPKARLPVGDAALARLLNADAATSRANLNEVLLEGFRTRTTPNFFAPFSSPKETLGELRRRFDASAKDKLVARARRIGEGRFDLLGLRDLNFGNPVNWHLEPLTNKVAPLVHWSRINYLSAEVAGDKKIIWELNRHQYFLTLGRAYWLTGDESYAETFARHINGWMRHNPPKQGINWASSLEVSFRAISWLWALHFFKDSTHLTAPLMSDMMRYLYVHARHLETYLSTYFSPNTHLTGEALGLFYLGTLLPQFRRAGVWRAKGRRILLGELARQVQADGVYFEQSSYYQRYTADFYTHFLLLSRRNGDALAPLVEEKLTLLLDHLMYITRPDGTTPFFGDDDGGKLLLMDEQRPANDFRATLATAAVIFKRADYKFVAGELPEETFWLLGGEGARVYDELAARPPAQTSVAFPHGGYYVMRDGWTSASNYLMLDCGPHGALNCGHAHADALSFDLAARGRTLLVDPGTYTYTGSGEMRDLFRSSAAHNVLTVNSESSSLPAGTFSWEHIARCAAEGWTSGERFDLFTGAHDGYARLPEPVSHSRSVLFLKGDYWIMRDVAETTGTYRYDLNFHFAPAAEPVIDEGEMEIGTSAAHGSVVRERTDGEAAGLDMFAFARGGEWQKESGLVSRQYGEASPAPVCIFSSDAQQGAFEAVTFLVPRTARAVKTYVREIEARGGRAFEVECEDEPSRDVLLIHTERDMEASCIIDAATFASDGAWAWARFDRRDAATAMPREWLLIDGTRLVLDGREIFKTGRRITYATAQIAGDELRMKVSDDAGDFDVLPPVDVRRVTLNGRSFDVERAASLSFKDGELRRRGGAEREVLETLV